MAAVVTVITGTSCLQVWETHGWSVRMLSIIPHMEILSYFYMD